MSEVAYIRKTDVRKLADAMIKNCKDHDLVAGFYCVLDHDGVLYSDCCGEMKKDVLWMIEQEKHELLES